MASASETTARTERIGRTHEFVERVHGVRYQTENVSESGGVSLLLSGPGASGSRPMPNGQPQAPGGWNRVVLRVTNLAAFIDTLKKDGVHFRNTMETGPAGKQIQIEDPDGNPIELFEPSR